MNTSRVYIGEIFQKKENEDRRIGYKALYYDRKNDVYFLLGNSNYKYEYGSNNVSNGDKYIKQGSLISYETFTRKSIIFKHKSYGTIEYNCRLQVRQMIEQRAIKLYSPKYTNEEIRQIHESGNYTLVEKAIELMDIGLCFSGNATNNEDSNCNKYQNCLECTYASLSETKKKEFEPFLKKKKVNEEGPTLVKKI